MRHVDEGTIHAWLDEQITDASEAAWIDEHLRTCAACGARLAAERAAFERAEALLADAAPAAPRPSFESLLARSAAPAGGGTAAAEAGGRSGAIASSIWLRAGWAASLVLALGLGWTARDWAGPAESVLGDTARVERPTDRAAGVGAETTGGSLPSQTPAPGTPVDRVESGAATEGAAPASAAPSGIAPAGTAPAGTVAAGTAPAGTAPAGTATATATAAANARAAQPQAARTLDAAGAQAAPAGALAQESAAAATGSRPVAAPRQPGDTQFAAEAPPPPPVPPSLSPSAPAATAASAAVAAVAPPTAGSAQRSVASAQPSVASAPPAAASAPAAATAPAQRPAAEAPLREALLTRREGSAAGAVATPVAASPDAPGLEWRAAARTEAAVRTGMPLYGIDGLSPLLTSVSSDRTAVRTVYRIETGEVVELVQTRGTPAAFRVAVPPAAAAGELSVQSLAPTGRPGIVVDPAVAAPRALTIVRGDVRLVLSTTAAAANLDALGTRLRLD